MSQHNKLILALSFAIVAGLCLHPFSQYEWLQAVNSEVLKPVGQIFLRLIFMVVVPLVFSALVVAAFELGKAQGLKVIALKTLGYTVIISALSVVIGIGLVNTFKPGSGFNVSENLHKGISASAPTLKIAEDQLTKKKSISEALVELLPKNPIDSAARALDGEIIPLMIFALFFGLSLSITSSRGADTSNILADIFDKLYAVSMTMMQFAMKIAPFGIFALVFNTVFIAGTGILISLFLYVLTVLIGLLMQQFIVYGFFLKVFALRSPLQFFTACKEVYLYAFSTSSSNATLPKALQIAETKLGIPKDISRFVLTIGSCANQNGTAIFEGVTVLFLAQVYGIALSLGQQIYVVFFSILAGVGTAGVPGGSLPLIMVLLQTIGIPAEGIGLILGVDRFLDMCRTTLNVSGDLVIAALVTPKKEAVATRDLPLAAE